jgi:hypothetical protein
MDLPSKRNGGGSSMDNALKINRVKYAKRPRLAMVNKRHNVRHFFDKTNYTNADSEMVCKLISSTDFINPANCYIVMDLQVTLLDGTAATDAYYLPRGIGAGSLISQVYVSTRDGTQIELIQHADVATRSKIWCRCQPDYLKNYAQVAQVDAPNDLNDLLTVDPANADLKTKTKVIIPLYWLCGLFNPDNDLIPPQLSSNLRIRLTLNNIKKMLFKVGTTQEIVKLTIENAIIVTDNLSMMPSVQKAVMDNCSTGKDGLQFSFETCFGQQGVAPSTAVDEQVNKSVGLASKVCWVYQDYQNAAAPGGSNVSRGDFTGSSFCRTIEQRVRLGDLYWHVSALQTDSARQTQEFYHNTVYSCTKTDCRAPAYPIPYKVWSAASTAPTTGAAIAASDKYYNYNEQTLERSDVLESSGLPINSGRALVISNKFDAATANRIIKSHLYYLTTLDIFPTNIVVNI